MTTEERKSILSFDPKISMGHIITIVVLLVSVGISFQNIRLEISEVEHTGELERLRIQVQVDDTASILGRLIEEQKTNRGGRL